MIAGTKKATPVYETIAPISTMPRFCGTAPLRSGLGPMKKRPTPERIAPKRYCTAGPSVLTHMPATTRKIM